MNQTSQIRTNVPTLASQLASCLAGRLSISDPTRCAVARMVVVCCHANLVCSTKYVVATCTRSKQDCHHHLVDVLFLCPLFLLFASLWLLISHQLPNYSKPFCVLVISLCATVVCGSCFTYTHMYVCVCFPLAHTKHIWYEQIR